MILYIKNMVCNRCKMVVANSIQSVGLHPVRVELGEVEIEEDDITAFKPQLRIDLQNYGFDLLSDKKARTVEKIKNLITELVHHHDNRLDTNLSEYLSTHIHQDYSTLSGQFSEAEGITIEKYYILQKIERVKELLTYDEMSLSQIADRLHYSSVAYLSYQFKKVTGRTPTQYKNSGNGKREGLDNI